MLFLLNLAWKGTLFPTIKGNNSCKTNNFRISWIYANGLMSHQIFFFKFKKTKIRKMRNEGTNYRKNNLKMQNPKRCLALSIRQYYWKQKKRPILDITGFFLRICSICTHAEKETCNIQYRQLLLFSIVMYLTCTIMML